MQWRQDMEKLPTGKLLEASKTLRSGHSTLPSSGANAKLRQALADRLAMPEAIEAVGKMISAFPSGGPQNPDGYIGALASVLREYPREIARRCADPIKGVARETRFLPTVADVVA